MAPQILDIGTDMAESIRPLKKVTNPTPGHINPEEGCTSSVDPIAIVGMGKLPIGEL